MVAWLQEVLESWAGSLKQGHLQALSLSLPLPLSLYTGVWLQSVESAGRTTFLCG